VEPIESQGLSLSRDELFDDQALRTLAHTQFGGSDFGECVTTMQRVPPGDPAAWHREWTATADRVTALGDACFAAGHRVSARECYLRASNYYRTSYVMLFGAPPAAELVRAFGRESATFRQFAALAEPPVEPVEIPYEGTTLPGYFCRAANVAGRSRTLIVTNGYDSTVHELYFGFAVAATRRGYHCLLFDGPGQGRALVQQGMTLRQDWEAVIRPVVDYALQRPEVDAARVALAGWSLGGYLSLRGVSGEPRLAACISDPGMMGMWEPLRKMLAGLPAEVLDDPRAADPALFAPFLERINASPTQRWKVVQRAFWVHGVSSLTEYVAVARKYTNRHTVRSVRCPVFLAMEEGDPLADWAPEAYECLTGPKTLARFRADEGAGGHCAMMARSLFHQRAFDWLDDVLK
jgi:pimeloyl-ACP methyl ester carboxylesterase